MVKNYWNGIDKKTNPVGFGCWQIAGTHEANGRPNGWGAIDQKTAVQLITHAIEHGIDFFDTAQAYNEGMSERLLGEAIKKTKSEVVVCTKITLSDEEIAASKLGVDFRKRFERSLKNLQTECIDILLLHNPPDQIDWSNFDFEVLNDLCAKGSIGTYGISCRSIKGAQNAIEHHFGTTIEWVFNIFERRPIDQLFPQVRKKNLNFIARSPLSRGLINPKYLTQNPVFGKDDFRSTLPSDWLEWLTKELRTYHQNGIAADQLVQNAIVFCTQFEAVKATIVGIKTQEQVSDLIRINDLLSKGTNFDFSNLEHVPAFYPKWA